MKKKFNKRIYEDLKDFREDRKKTIDHLDTAHNYASIAFKNEYINITAFEGVKGDIIKSKSNETKQEFFIRKN